MSIVNLSNYLLCIFCFLFLDACDTNKAINTSNTTEQPRMVLVELEEALTSAYLFKNYSNFAISKILKSNRTKNQYSLSFAGEQTAFKELINSFKKDKNIVDVQLSGEQNSDRMNSINDKKAKARPQKKN